MSCLSTTEMHKCISVIEFNKYVDQTDWIHFNKYVDGTYCQALGIMGEIEKQTVLSRDLVCIRDAERSKLQNNVRSLVSKECIRCRNHTEKELSSLERGQSVFPGEFFLIYFGGIITLLCGQGRNSYCNYKEQQWQTYCRTALWFKCIRLLSVSEMWVIGKRTDPKSSHLLSPWTRPPPLPTPLPSGNHHSVVCVHECQFDVPPIHEVTWFLAFLNGLFHFT